MSDNPKTVPPIQRNHLVTLADCPIGLFRCGGKLCLKTEYGSSDGRIDAYVVSSGEFFWGGADKASEQRKVMVQPVTEVKVAPTPQILQYAPDVPPSICEDMTGQRRHSPSPQTHVQGDWEGREGCVGAMTASRASYFLERFKREEKMLGPHEQWALDFAIAALATEGKA